VQRWEDGRREGGKRKSGIKTWGAEVRGEKSTKKRSGIHCGKRGRDNPVKKKHKRKGRNKKTSSRLEIDRGRKKNVSKASKSGKRYKKKRLTPEVPKNDDAVKER